MIAPRRNAPQSAGRRYERVHSGKIAPGSLFWAAFFVCWFSAAGAGVFGYVYLNGKSERLASARAELESKADVQAEKLRNAQVVLESYKSGKYIFRRIKEWNLDLHESSPEQITGILPDGQRAPDPPWVRESILAQNR